MFPRLESTIFCENIECRLKKPNRTIANVQNHKDLNLLFCNDPTPAMWFLTWLPFFVIWNENWVSQ